MSPYQLNDVTQHVGAGDTLPARVVDSEDTADITLTRCRQHGIAQRMHRDVTVGVSGAAVGVSEQQAHQPAGPTGFNRMHIGAQTDPGRLVHRRTILFIAARSPRPATDPAGW